MKKIIFTTLLVFLLSSLTLAAGNDGEPVLKRSFPTASIKNVVVDVALGSVSLDGNAISDATVEVFASLNGKRSKAAELTTNDYEITIEEKSGTLQVISKLTKKNSDVSLSFKISVGKNTGSEIKTGTGSIHLENLEGDQQFKTGTGSVQATNISGKTEGTTGTGSIKLTGLKGRVSVSSGSGSIKATDVEAALTVKTGVGSLQFDNISGILKGSSGSGSIQVSNASSDVDVSTEVGSITAKNCNAGKKINLQTGSGSMLLSNLSGTITGKTDVGSLSLNDLKGTIITTTGSGSVKAKNVDGTLKVSSSVGSLNLSSIAGNLDAQSGSGSVAIKMTSVSDYLKLVSKSAGSININLPNKGYNLKVKGGQFRSLKNFKGAFETGNIDGKIGEGGPEINIVAPKDQRVQLNFE